MRATTPLDELQHLGDVVSLPLPKYPVGTRVSASKLTERDRRYYYKLIVRSVLRKTRKVLRSLQRQGYVTDMKGQKMLPGNKERLQAILDVVRNADSIEIAGHAPDGMHVVGTLGNQCYLRNGQCHSGVSYRAYLLFRREVDGNKVVYLHPEPLLNEACVKALLAS